MRFCPHPNTHSPKSCVCIEPALPLLRMLARDAAAWNAETYVSAKAVERVDRNPRVEG